MPIDDAVSRIVSEYPEIVSAWIFGSVARGDASDASDLDVAVLLEDPSATAVTFHRRLRDLAARLEDAAMRPVDLAVLGLHDPILAHEVLAGGRLVLDRDRARRIGFECDALSRYFDWAPTWEAVSKRSLEVNRTWAKL